MATLFLVRHGQASFGTHDYDRLSSLGVRQAQQAGQYLCAVAGGAVRIVSGSLVRHRETAAGMARSLSAAHVESVRIQIDERFNELDLDSLIAQLASSLRDVDGTLATLLSEATTSSRSYQKLVKRRYPLSPRTGSWRCRRIARLLVYFTTDGGCRCRLSTRGQGLRDYPERWNLAQSEGCNLLQDVAF